MSPSGLSLATFPAMMDSSLPPLYANSNGQFQFHLPHRENVASSSRAVFGSSNTDSKSCDRRAMFCS